MQQAFSISEIKTWDRFYRTNFINSLSGFKSASLIGSVNADGLQNLALFSNIVHLGADPALIGFVNRPREATPHTLHNIETTKAYTINLFTEQIVTKAHQTSAKYPAHVSEFEATGLPPELLNGWPAAFVKESPVKYAVELVEIIPIKHNNTFFVIGEIKAAYVPQELILNDGTIDLERAEVLTSMGLETYLKTQKVIKLPYAKP